MAIQTETIQPYTAPDTTASPTDQYNSQMLYNIYSQQITINNDLADLQSTIQNSVSSGSVDMTQTNNLLQSIDYSASNLTGNVLPYTQLYLPLVAAIIFGIVVIRLFINFRD